MEWDCVASNGIVRHGMRLPYMHRRERRVELEKGQIRGKMKTTGKVTFNSFLYYDVVPIAFIDHSYCLINDPYQLTKHVKGICSAIRLYLKKRCYDTIHSYDFY